MTGEQARDVGLRPVLAHLQGRVAIAAAAGVDEVAAAQDPIDRRRRRPRLGRAAGGHALDHRRRQLAPWRAGRRRAERPAKARPRTATRERQRTRRSRRWIGSWSRLLRGSGRKRWHAAQVAASGRVAACTRARIAQRLTLRASASSSCSTSLKTTMRLGADDQGERAGQHAQLGRLEALARRREGRLDQRRAPVLPRRQARCPRRAAASAPASAAAAPRWRGSCRAARCRPAAAAPPDRRPARRAAPPRPPARPCRARPRAAAPRRPGK